jgi:hypothetical protein
MCFLYSVMIIEFLLHLPHHFTSIIYDIGHNTQLAIYFSIDDLQFSFFFLMF